MGGKYFVILDKRTGAIVRRLGKDEVVIPVAPIDNVPDGEDLADKVRRSVADVSFNTKYDWNRGAYNSRVTYKSFVKVNQERLVDLFDPSLTNTEIRIAGLMLSAIPYQGGLSLDNVRTILNGYYPELSSRLSERGLKKRLNTLCRHDILVKTNSGKYTFNPNLAIKGNFVRTSTLQNILGKNNNGVKDSETDED